MSMVFYEIEHGVGTDHFLFERNTDHSFPLHMHRCYEMVLMLEGEMKIQLDEREYILQAGDLILIKPNRLHRYETETGKGSTCLLCVFSGDLIAAIHDALSKHRLRSAVIRQVPALYREVFETMGRAEDLPTVKGSLYLLCALFYRLTDQTAEEESVGDAALLHKVFTYVENHIADSCNLSDLARELKYNESYLSRIFAKHVRTPYSEFVRAIRIDHACYLLRNTDESVYKISVKCGYTTQSSFNRSFKQITGVTPNQYRAGEGRSKPRMDEGRRKNKAVAASKTEKTSGVSEQS